MSYRKARTQCNEISLWLTHSTYHNPAEKKTLINHTAIVFINYTTISRQFLLRMRNVSENRYRQNRNTHFMFSDSSRKLRRLWDNVVKYCRVGQDTDDNMVHATNTHSKYVIKLKYCLSIARAVAWTLLSSMLYVLCLPCVSILLIFNFAHFDPILLQWLILIVFYSIFVFLCLVLFKCMLVLASVSVT